MSSSRFLVAKGGIFARAATVKKFKNQVCECHAATTAPSGLLHFLIRSKPCPRPFDEKLTDSPVGKFSVPAAAASKSTLAQPPAETLEHQYDSPFHMVVHAPPVPAVHVLYSVICELFLMIASGLPAACEKSTVCGVGTPANDGLCHSATLSEFNDLQNAMTSSEERTSHVSSKRERRGPPHREVTDGLLCFVLDSKGGNDAIHQCPRADSW